MTRPSSLADLATIFDSQSISGTRNRIINGDMRIDQRNAGAAVTFGAGVGYAVDRHPVFNAGPNSITSQRVSVAGLTGFINALRITGSASNLGVSYFHRLEANNVYDLAGVTVTFSAWVWAGAARNVTPIVTTPNSFENFASQTSGGSTTWSVTTTPTRFTWTFTMPANAVNGAEMAIQCGAILAGETVNITGVQLEAGPFATPFERRSFGQELMLCQRYFERWDGGTGDMIGPVGQAFGSTTGETSIIYVVEKRAAPVVTTSGSFNVWTGAGQVNPSTIGFAEIRTRQLTWQYSGASGGSVGQAIQFFASGGAAALLISAEL